jgi:curved DNA-binding protein CbpA
MSNAQTKRITQARTFYHVGQLLNEKEGLVFEQVYKNAQSNFSKKKQSDENKKILVEKYLIAKINRSSWLSFIIYWWYRIKQDDIDLYVFHTLQRFRDWKTTSYAHIRPGEEAIISMFYRGFYAPLAIYWNTLNPLGELFRLIYNGYRRVTGADIVGSTRQEEKNLVLNNERAENMKQTLVGLPSSDPRDNNFLVLDGREYTTGELYSTQAQRIDKISELISEVLEENSENDIILFDKKLSSLKMLWNQYHVRHIRIIGAINLQIKRNPADALWKNILRRFDSLKQKSELLWVSMWPKVLQKQSIDNEIAIKMATVVALARRFQEIVPTDLGMLGEGWKSLNRRYDRIKDELNDLRGIFCFEENCKILEELSEYLSQVDAHYAALEVEKKHFLEFIIRRLDEKSHYIIETIESIFTMRRNANNTNVSEFIDETDPLFLEFDQLAEQMGSKKTTEIEAARQRIYQLMLQLRLDLANNLNILNDRNYSIVSNENVVLDNSIVLKNEDRSAKDSLKEDEIPVQDREYSFLYKHSHEVLGIKINASQHEIKKAFRSKSLACHPDKVPEDEQKEANFNFEEINKAFKYLTFHEAYAGSIRFIQKSDNSIRNQFMRKKLSAQDTDSICKYASERREYERIIIDQVSKSHVEARKILKSMSEDMIVIKEKRENTSILYINEVNPALSRNRVLLNENNASLDDLKKRIQILQESIGKLSDSKDIHTKLEQ